MRRGGPRVERWDGSCVTLREDNCCRANPAKPNQCGGFPKGANLPGSQTLCKAWPVPEEE
jgi:Fe-S-cluster containining protein